ncbi:MAG TPA: diguanylate cyclase [Thermoanaerobaculia bacterium]|nr:diguanylate cyclase [Thermoanaerobaculia bacterium]
MHRPRLRSRVLLLTGAFAVVLFAVTFGLSWRAHQAQQRWSRLIGVETEAIGSLEELIRAQNAYRAHFVPGPDAPARYRVVTQLLQSDALQFVDTGTLRGRVRAFREVIAEPAPRAEDVAATSTAVVAEAQRIVGERKREIARQLPALERDTNDMMRGGLAVAWIIVLFSFAVVQTTLRKVVRPIEELSAAADRIAAGDVTAQAPVAGDREIATLAVALNRMADELKARARTDELTELPNFRAFRERIDGEIERAGRYPENFGVLVLDLDRFKKYNDTFGHPAGNDALQRVARVIRDTVRAVDFPARYGGEEFAVIVPNIDARSLSAIAERIRAGVEAMPAPADGAQVTVSIGAAIYPVDGADREALFNTADERLYAAKKAGRNRVMAPTPGARSAVPASA